MVLNPTQVMGFFNVCVFTVPVLSRVGRDLAMGQSPLQGVPPHVCKQGLKSRKRGGRELH
jgi:hypothetical protein